jgi:hypothetical protein
MNENPSRQPNGSLDETLKSWRLEESLPPRFEARVWSRIVRAEAEAPHGRWALWETINRAFARPRLAAGYLTVLLFLGMAAGYWKGQASKAQALESLSVRYVQLVDPYRNRH